jgi:hypothetical protein
MFTLYRLTFSSGKIYIGQTSRPFKVRMNAHRTAANRGSMLPVHCAWRAHGEPTAEVLCTLNTQDELNAAEVATIKALNTLAPHGYNISLGGDMAPSKNPEVAAKIAAKAKGRKHKDVQMWVESSKAKWKDPEYREKVAAGVDAFWTEDRRAKVSERSKSFWAKRKAEGWTVPEETREKLRKKVVTDETRAKMSESAKKRERKPQSDATRKKRSEMMKAIWAQRRGQ